MRPFIVIGIVFLLFCFYLRTEAQSLELKILNDQVYAIIDLSMDDEIMDSLLFDLGLDSSEIAQLKQGPEKGREVGNWTCVSSERGEIQLKRPLDELTGKLDRNEVIFLDDKPIDVKPSSYWYQDVGYGVNSFKKIQSVKELENGKTRFFLLGHFRKNEAYIAGNFNGWSTIGTPLNKTDSGWHVDLKIPYGKTVYKFVVDGDWLLDPLNRQSQKDENGLVNSVYFKPNYSFTLGGHESAKKVFVAGDFNQWRDKELPLIYEKGQWRLPIYLREGTYGYKFIVDDNWILDPKNPLSRPDGVGNLNSWFSFGDTIFFILKGNKNADRVNVAGNFNDWNSVELSMIKTDSGWVLPYVLPDGNWEYKFIVDGAWITDPENRVTTGVGDFRNSILSVGKNYTFRLNGFQDAGRVICTGSFNNWNNNGYKMARKDGHWEISLFMRPGKHTYKFLVDGEWVLDPGNPLWEQNEFGTGNSVLWLDARTLMGVE